MAGQNAERIIFSSLDFIGQILRMRIKIQSLYWNKQDVVVRYQNSSIKMEHVKSLIGELPCTGAYSIYVTLFTRVPQKVQGSHLWVSNLVSRLSQERKHLEMHFK